MSVNAHSDVGGVTERVVPEEIASSDLSYLSDIEEEADTASFSLNSSQANSSALSSGHLDDHSVCSEVSSTSTENGALTLDWRGEMAPGSVSMLIFSLVAQQF